MAGFYNDAPGARMGIDADGTIGMHSASATTTFVVGSGILQPWIMTTQAGMTALNSEDATEDVLNSFADMVGCIIFPEKRDIDGLFAAGASAQSSGTESSVDTTNGLDGTWLTMSYAGFGWQSDDQYRNNINAQSLTGIRGLRFQNGATISDWRAMHTYGSMASGETPDRIIFLDEASGLEFGQSTAPEIMDFGDRPRGSIIDHEFRLRNNSTVAGNNLTATTIVLTRQALEGVMDTWIQYDEAGGGFMDSETVTSLAPETNSALLTLRLDIADAAVLFVWAARTKVAVTTWA